MDLNTLKNLSVSALLLFLIGCEDSRYDEGTPVDDSYGTVYVSVESVPSIELNDFSWQTLRTIWGDLSSEDSNIKNIRVEWESDMFWIVTDTTGYFKADCRTCETGTWYGTDGTVENMSYDFHTMAPVTNYVSITDENGSFGNVIAPVRSMRGDAMWLWWSVASVFRDSMLIVLE